MNGNAKGHQNDPLDFSSDASTAKETLDILGEMSSIMKTGLDVESLAISYRLVENGINPQALADVISKLQNQVEVSKKKEPVADNGDV